MKRLVRFYLDCGRMGHIEGLSVYSEEEWCTIEEAVSQGKTLYFYEILGKHSEISVKSDEGGLFTVISEDQDFLDKLVPILGWHISGVYPLDYF